MILSKKQILQRIDSGDLQFTPPLDKFQIQQHAIDLRMGFRFMVPLAWRLSEKGRVAVEIDHLNPLENKEQFSVVELEEGQVFDVLPGEYVAVATLERIKLPLNLMAVLYPRSSVNRRGLSIDLTGIIDAGYEGHLLIPIRNNTRSQTVRIYPGERFCQIVLEEVADGVEAVKSRWDSRDVADNIQAEKSDSETELVQSGRIDELKDKYKM